MLYFWNGNLYNFIHSWTLHVDYIYSFHEPNFKKLIFWMIFIYMIFFLTESVDYYRFCWSDVMLVRKLTLELFLFKKIFRHGYSSSILDFSMDCSTKKLWLIVERSQPFLSECNKKKLALKWMGMATENQSWIKEIDGKNKCNAVTDEWNFSGLPYRKPRLNFHRWSWASETQYMASNKCWWIILFFLYDKRCGDIFIPVGISCAKVFSMSEICSGNIRL